MTLDHRPGTVAVSALAFWALAASEAAAGLSSAPSMACPGGFQPASVTELVSAGYLVAGAVDDPTSGLETFGRPGNGNGQVCIRAMGNQTTHFGGQYYVFADDGLRAG